MTTIRSGKAGWVGSGKPNQPHLDAPRLKVADGTNETFLRTPVPGERGENCTAATLALTVADSDVVGAVTFTLRRVAERLPWSDLTWNKVDGIGVTGAAATVDVTDPVAGDVIEFDVAALCQSAIDGRHYGWRLTSSSASVTKFFGFNAEDGPVLDLTVTAEPAAATDLVPNGVGSLEKPFLQWTAPDLNGGDNQTAFQVQVALTAAPAEDADGTWTAPTYDSTTVVDPAPELDLSATAFAGVADGAEFWWQVRWQSETGLWSPWSDTAHYEREAKPTWTFANPTLGEVDSTQPTFEATLSGVGTLKAYRYRLALASKPHRIIADSRKDRATSQTATWLPMEMSAFVGDDREPVTLQDGETYRLTLDGWRPQSGGYVGSVGDPIAVREVVEFTVNEDTGIEAPVLVSVEPHPTLPVNLVNVTRSTAPDALVLYRNGRAVVTIDADDAHVAGTSYQVPDASGRGMRDHEYRVRAQVDGAGLSALSDPVTAALTPEGVWVVSRDLSRYVRLTGNRIPEMARGDEVGVFRVQGRDGEMQNVVIRSGRGKVDSRLTLDLDDLSRPLEESLADLEAIWEADEPAFVIAANKSLKVRILDVSHTPHELTLPGQVRDVVSLRYVEVG